MSVTPEMVKNLERAIDELGRDIAALDQRGALSTDELATYFLDAVVLLRATYSVAADAYQKVSDET